MGGCMVLQCIVKKKTEGDSGSKKPKEMQFKKPKGKCQYILLNGRRCGRRPLDEYNGRHSQRRQLEIFKIE